MVVAIAFARFLRESAANDKVNVCLVGASAGSGAFTGGGAAAGREPCGTSGVAGGTAEADTVPTLLMSVVSIWAGSLLAESSLPNLTGSSRPAARAAEAVPPNECPEISRARQIAHAFAVRLGVNNYHIVVLRERQSAVERCDQRKVVAPCRSKRANQSARSNGNNANGIAGF